MAPPTAETHGRTGTDGGGRTTFLVHVGRRSQGGLARWMGSVIPTLGSVSTSDVTNLPNLLTCPVEVCSKVDNSYLVTFLTLDTLYLGGM